ncbi:MAG: hypothetical protein V4499_07660 [Pseudomonadota bacterium]
MNEFFAPPFALSLSKGCFVLVDHREGQGFDNLSPNGIVYV